MVDKDKVRISGDLAIPLADIEISAVRAQGPGGQNVNKLSTAIHLRFDFESSQLVSDRLKEKLRQLRDRRITTDGCIVIKSQRYRSREKNRHDAIDRLTRLLRAAQAEKKPRKPTRPGKHVRRKQLDAKKRRGRLKQSRGKVPE